MSYADKTLSRLNESLKEKDKYQINLLDKQFVIYPNVFSPKYFNDTEFFVDNLKVKKGEDFLEIGCGTGIISIFASFKGASKVVAIDISPIAVENTRENILLHKLSKKMSVLLGEVYSPLEENQIFDTIFWNVPFLYENKSKISLLESSVFDPGYNMIEKFISGAHRHLKQNGRLLIGFSTTMGNYNKLKELLDKYGFSLKLLKKETINYDYPIDSVNLELFEAKPL